MIFVFISKNPVFLYNNALIIQWSVILTSQLILQLWMSAIKKRQQEWWPGHVAKGCLMVSLDNEVHVSSLNVIQRREVTMQSCVSIPTSTFLLQQADWNGAGHGVLHVDWPLGGEPALKRKKYTVCAWLCPALFMICNLSENWTRNPFKPTKSWVSNSNKA